MKSTVTQFTIRLVTCSSVGYNLWLGIMTLPQKLATQFFSSGHDRFSFKRFCGQLWLDNPIPNLILVNLFLWVYVKRAKDLFIPGAGQIERECSTYSDIPFAFSRR